MPLPKPAQKPNIKRYHEALVSISVDVESLYKQLGLTSKTMQDDNASISMAKYLQLLEAAALQTNNPHLGLALLRNYDEKSLGIITYILNNAGSVQHGLALLQEYLSLISPGSVIGMESSGETSAMSYRVGDFPAAQCIQDAEKTVMQLLFMLRNQDELKSWWPKEIYFQHAQPKGETQESSPFPTKVIYDHHYNGFCFPTNILERSLDNADPQLLSILQAQAKQTAHELPAGGDLLEKTRQIIVEHLGSNAADADAIAIQLGMSRSSLQRRLREFGVTIKALREDIIFEKAKESLATSDISITELALALGYSDSSAFDRAFKRLSTITPLQYRKEHRLD